LWRQRFPAGAVEPITSGPATDEEGIAIAPDGRSVITSLGRHQSSIWLHDTNGERVLSSEGFGFDPLLAAGAARLYYLLRRVSSYPTAELTVLDLASGRTERLLPDFSILDYDVSRDETEVAFTTAGSDGELQIWLARLDRSAAPRLVVRGGDSVAFSGKDLFFRSVEGHANFIDRVTLDGKTRVRLSNTPAVHLFGSSPDGRWAIAGLSRAAEGGSYATTAVDAERGTARRICTTPCALAWSPDGRWLHVSAGGPVAARSTVAIPVPAGRVFPDFPEGNGDAITGWARLPGVESFDRVNTVPGNDPSTYVFVKTDDRRNLFRVPLTSR
jgi:hypothetical protein